MPFIQQNLDIILAGSAIVVLLVLYIIIKKAKTKKELQELNDYSDIEVVEDIYDQGYTEELQEDQSDEEPKKSEGLSLDISKSQAPKTDEASPPNHNPKSNVSVIEVPPHGKINKEDFKDFAGIKVLVAEDNLINQKVIAGLLGESGIEVVFANDGLETISYLNNQKDFDIILMDAHMPNMDGFEATRKIRENPEYDNLPVIALSGDVASDDIKKMYDAGMDGHLEKPLKMDALYDILYAFTKKGSASASSEAELNKSVGIEISGGDEGFYKEILEEFVKDYQDAKERIKSLLENAEIEKADALLLDLIGITANIGADRVNSAAITLKKALQTPDTGEYKKAYKEFADSFDRLLVEIKSYI